MKTVSIFTAKQIRAARSTLKFSQSEMGEALGVGRQTIWEWESGGYDVPLAVTLAVKHLLATYSELSPRNSKKEKVHAL